MKRLYELRDRQKRKEQEQLAILKLLLAKPPKKYDNPLAEYFFRKWIRNEW